MVHYSGLNHDFAIDLKNRDIFIHNIDAELNWKVTLIDTGLKTLKGGRIKGIEKCLDSETIILNHGKTEESIQFFYVK